MTENTKQKIIRYGVLSSLAGGTIAGTAAGCFVGQCFVEQIKPDSLLEIAIVTSIYGISMLTGIKAGIYAGVMGPYYIAKGLDKLSSKKNSLEKHLDP